MKRKKYWTACIDVIAHKRNIASHVAEPTDALAVPYGQSVINRSDVKTCLSDLLGGLVCEAVVLIMLDSSNHVIGGARLAVGVSTACYITPKQIFCAALLCGATSIILAHNHPGGAQFASEPDWEITNAVYKAGVALSIALLDHVIVTENATISLRESPRWPR